MILLFANTFLVAQNAYMPPDYFPDQSASQTLRLYPNDGQLINTANDLVPEVKYYHLSGANPLYLMDDKIAFTQFVPATASKSDPDTLLRIDMLPYKSQTQSTPKAYYQSQDHVNFYYPHCSEGVTDVHGYDRIVYENYFPDIDLHVTSNSTWHKFFLVLHPNANASKLELEFEGQDQITIVNNALRLSLNQRTFEIPQATAYQSDANGNITSSSWLPAFLNAGNGVVQFNIGNYNTSEYLVLEFAFPTSPSGPPPPFSGNLEWCTAYGGSDFDFSGAITTDINDNMYLAGETFSNDFPNIIGTSAFSGNTDAYVVKIDDGTFLQWATYIGGSSFDKAVRAIVTPMSGNPTAWLRVIGDTKSSNIPINPTIEPTWYSDVHFGNSPQAGGQATDETEVFITTLVPTTGVLQHSTFFGKKGLTNLADVEYDAVNGYIYLSGEGKVPNLGLSGTLGSNGGGFIAKLNHTDLQINFSGQFGNSGKVLAVNAIHFDNNQNVFIGSRCEDGAINVSATYGNSNTFQQTIFGGGSEDGFIAKIRNSTLDLAWSSYLGGSDFEEIHDIEVDSYGDVYYSGLAGDGLPVSVGGDGFIGDRNGYFLKLDNNGNSIFSTYVGGVLLDEPNQLAIDQDDNIYLWGTVEVTQTSPGSPLSGFQIQNWLNYYQQGQNAVDIHEPFLIVRDKNLNIKWGTFFGSSSSQFSGDIHIGNNDKLYLTGDGDLTMTNFPFLDPLPNNSNNLFNSSQNGQEDFFIARFDLHHYRLSVKKGIFQF